MSFQTQLSSNTFTIDDTRNQIPLHKHFHKASTQIIKQGQPRKVVFGQMQQQQRSVYEIVSPYVASMAKTTGNLALQAGSIAYGYLKQGFWWFYDQLTNKVIPYTRQQIPKLIFIIAKSSSPSTTQSIKSGQFCVLQMEDQDYNQLNRKQRQHQGPIKVLIPLGNKDEALIQQIKKNYQVSYSFPIEDLVGDSENISLTICIPSESFEILESSARKALREEGSRVIDLAEIKVVDQNSDKKLEVKVDQSSNVQKKPEDLLNEKLSKQRLSQDQQWQQVKLSSTKPKAIFLPDACCFIYQQQHQLYPMLKQGLQRDTTAVVGHLISSQQYKQRGSRDSSEGEVPMVTIDQKIGKNIEVRQEVELQEQEVKKKVVDAERKVRPQVGKNLVKNEMKKEEKYEMQLY